MTADWVVLLPASLLGFQHLTTNLYLPNLPALSGTLGAYMAQTQRKLSSLHLAFGRSQLVRGPVSDRIGIRQVLLIGLAAHLLASLASAMSASIDSLIALSA